MRTVATRASRSTAYGLTPLTLKLAHAYRALAGARGGLSATVNVTFAAAGHKTLRESVAVTFERVAPPAGRKNARRAKRARRGGPGSGGRGR
jgi:short subunit fatty acids transporter